MSGSMALRSSSQARTRRPASSMSALSSPWLATVLEQPVQQIGRGEGPVVAGEAVVREQPLRALAGLERHLGAGLAQEQALAVLVPVAAVGQAHGNLPALSRVRARAERQVAR